MRVPNLGETDLLVPLHEGVFEQPMWHRFLERLRTVAGADRAALLIRSPGSRGALQLLAGPGDPVPRFDHLLAGDEAPGPMREGRVYALEDLAEMAGQSAAELRRKHLPSLGCATIRAMRLHEHGGLEAWLVLAADDGLGPEAANLLSALTPHLRAALRVLAALERERARASVSADAFSRMNFGWISLDARCRILDLDPQAERFLRESGLLRRGPYDRLTPSSPAVDRQLTALVREFEHDRRARPRALNVSQDPWIDILVSPVRVTALAGDSAAVSVVYFRGDRSSAADRCEQLAELFGLTPSEARLAWSMVQGLTIAEAAGQHGLTVETARNYSKKIYAKTGASGQVDLVREVLTGVLALA
jgi:DNA-binding CsgD family transcriptional regulator